MQDFAMMVGEPTISSVLIGEHPDELGFRVKERNFAKRRIFESTDVSAGT